MSSSRLVSEKRAVQEMSVENKTASFPSLVLCFAIFVRKRHVTGLRPCVMLPNIEHKHIAVFFRVGGGGSQEVCRVHGNKSGSGLPHRPAQPPHMWSSET